MRPARNPYLLGKDQPFGRQTEYFAQESIDFIKSLGKYADNHYVIQIQKWGEEERTAVPCRIEDSFDEQANLKRGDDWKDILFYEPVENVTIGMLAWFENNTWLGFNTRNIASLTSSITVRRCDSMLNFVDEFNNVTPVPFVFDKYTVLNSTTIEKASQPVSLINGYKNAWVQYNDYTATMRTNDRFIINGMAWSVRGIDKVSRQSTENRDSVTMMAFVLMRTEERDGDDLVNDIADADANIWEVATTNEAIIGAIGDSGNVSCNLLHNGEVNTEYGILYSSSNEDVVTIDENGTYTVVGDGDAVITCTFEKNPNIYTEIAIQGVESAEATYDVVFAPVEAQIPQFETKTVTAYLYRNGLPTSESVSFILNGVPSKYYTAVYSDNSVEITCNAPYAKNKLTVTAKAEVDGTEYTDEISLSLLSAY